MKKNQLLAVGILSICLLASGCGAKKEEDATSEIVPIAPKTEETVETPQETETKEEAEEPEDPEDAADKALWEQVRISDGVGTIYNGDTVKLARPKGLAIGTVGTYEFKEPADFQQFAKADISYHGVDIKVWVSEPGKCRMSASGNYKLEALDDFGEYYDLVVDGKTIAEICVEGYNANKALEDCGLYSFYLYPSEELTLNGYEFKNLEMRKVVKNFGNPNEAAYWIYDDSKEECIIYSYRSKDSGAKDAAVSSWRFFTKDGKNIENIEIALAVTE